jgi:hypothetical protein
MDSFTLRIWISDLMDEGWGVMAAIRREAHGASCSESDTGCGTGACRLTPWSERRRKNPCSLRHECGSTLHDNDTFAPPEGSSPGSTLVTRDGIQQ